MGQRRIPSELDIYHVVARGTGKQLIFECDEDRNKFLSFFEHALSANKTEALAWCLMGNHVHLLLQAPLEQIAECMRYLCREYALYFNERYGRSGHLFQERYLSEPVTDEVYLMLVTRYIHFNPESAGICDFDTYEWSSYQEYLGEARYCKTEPILSLFGTVEEFMAFHDSRQDIEGFLEIGNRRSITRAMPDEIAIGIAKSVLGGVKLGDIKALNRHDRNERLRDLRASGLSIRQIERLTGISKNIISRA